MGRRDSEVTALSFASIHAIDDRVAEVIVNEGVEMDKHDVADFHEWLRRNLEAPFAVLVNKEHSYTHTAYAQKKLGDIPELAAIAVLTSSKVTELTTKVISRRPRESSWNMRVFPDRAEALEWLRAELRQKPIAPRP